MFHHKHIMNRGLLMDKIISEMYKLLKKSANPIDAEENLHSYMYEVFAEALGELFIKLNQSVKETKQQEGWKVKRNDWRTVQFVFGEIRYRRTLMNDTEGNNHYPLDEYLGIKKYRRYSPFVELKTAETASVATYRDTAHFINEWTPVELRHTTVDNFIKRVGKAQAEYDQAIIDDLEEAATLPEGKKVDFLYSEADGVFVRSTKKGKNIEVRHAITYEGWEKNGKRVSLVKPRIILTTQRSPKFWDEVQSLTANEYSLVKTKIITNSDGGKGYTAEKFREAFAQSEYPVLNQLDAYHVTQSLNRTFGMKDDTFKPKVRKAIQNHDFDSFILWMTTYESTLETEKDLEKFNDLKTYIVGNWDRIFDWRDEVEDVPDNARGLGAMESHQRRITYRMKKRGMHWSVEGCEAMVKIKQGMFNGTLRDAYLYSLKRSVRQQRQSKKIVSVAKLLHQKTRPSIGAQKGNIALYAPSSSPMGKLLKSFSS